MFSAGATCPVDEVPVALTAGRKPALSVRRRGGMPKVRTVYQIVGGGPHVGFIVHNNNLDNALRALVERVFMVRRDGVLVPTPKPEPHRIARRLARFGALLDRWLPKSTPISHDQFVGMYSGRRRGVYQSAVDSLGIRGVDRRDAVLSSFVKAEKVTGLVPRIIQPRGARYNVEVGVFLKPLEKAVYAAIARVFGSKTVLKGYNARQTGRILWGKWNKMVDPVGVGLDASRFDQHTSEDALRFEHARYLRCFSGSDRERLAWLLEWQIENVGRVTVPDGKIKYAVRGCRMSGDMNTSMGNCLLMCAMVFAYAEHAGVRIELANNGDDCTVIMERADLAQFTTGLDQWFTEMGYTMKVEEAVDVFERIDFCQTSPVKVLGGYVMVRNPHKALTKDVHSVLPLRQGKMAFGWATAIGECGMSLTGAVPVYQEFYSAMLRAGRGRRIGAHPGLESGFVRLAEGMSRDYGPILPETRFSFWLAFGVTPDEQEALEAYYREWKPDLSVILPREIADHSFPELL